MRDAPSIFTTQQVMTLTGTTRNKIRLIQEAKAAMPHYQGTTGRGNASLWTFMQTVGISYHEACLSAGLNRGWADGACKWIQSQKPGELLAAFAENRTILMLSFEGQGALIEPNRSEDATRAERILAATLNLQGCYERVWRKALEMVNRQRK
jgi:hypothetical protein